MTDRTSIPMTRLAPVVDPAVARPAEAHPAPQAWPGPYPTGPAGPPPPAGGTTAPGPRRGRRRLLLLLAVVAIAIIGYAVGGDGSSPPRTPGIEVPEPTALSPLDLQAGDCYNAAPLPADGSDARINSVEAVPCTDPHTAQVVAKLDYAGQDYTEVVETRAAADCAAEIPAGVRPEVLADPAYSFGQIHPDPLAWTRVTSVACIVVSGAPTAGSALS